MLESHACGLDQDAGLGIMHWEMAVSVFQSSRLISGTQACDVSKHMCMPA